ncbi:zinc finger protein 862-like [Mercenaria mercenaria]|uniref:zinc finger protein 862-like n=1 Tax=Mercenaria mercenaria TaxID=6596 RepID=UPI00234E8340|nr:zinc finger protein 862-like [Mercenaria mercenaria]
MLQTNLFTFLKGGQKRPHEENNVENQSLPVTPTKKTKSSVSDVMDSPLSASKKKIRKFNSDWTKEFEWLVHEPNNDGVMSMFCTLCRDSKKTNPFATTGSTNFQRSALERHGSKNPEHLDLILVQKLVNSKSTVKDVVEIQEVNNSESKCAQIRTLYYLAKNGHPLSMQNSLVELQQLNNCRDLRDHATIYSSSTTHDEMLDAISEVIEESVNADILSSDFVGIILDETTDLTVNKKLNIYFKSFKSGSTETVTHFIDCVDIENGKADTLVEEIEKVCARIGLDMLKVISMASDGASVMIGHKGGVGVKLREKHNPRLVQIHCVAHRLALCASQACQNVPVFADYQRTVKNVYRFFHNSAIRYNGLREIENLLTDENKDTKHVTLKEPASFRWLSLQNAVKAVFDVYPALVMALDNEAATGSSEAKGLLKSVKSVQFLLNTAFLVDILAVVNKLCKVFQRDELDIEQMNNMLCSTRETLQTFKAVSGSTLEETYKAISNGKYKDLVKVTDTSQLRRGFQSSSVKYLDNLLDNLDNRFEESSMKILTTADKILNPSHLPTYTEEIPAYGNEDLAKIVEWLGPLENYPGLIDPTNMKNDYLQFKLVLRKLQGKSLKNVCETLIQRYSESFPDFTVVAKYVLTAPLSSVACERGFSSQNRLKTKLRSRLESTKVSKMIRVMEEGPAVAMFDTQPVLAKFDKMKNRRK